MVMGLMDDRKSIKVRSNASSAGINWWLLMVGFMFHAPGLWLFFRRTVPAAARRENLAWVIVTMIAMAATAWFSGDWTLVVIIWLAGHFSWGARLAWHLSQDA